ncbi:hypothetical protein ABW19_dt0204282 [Dactylella cylindrospora]|nr:hypothetical protein ABW19_dt0204282 [Dactylella cylindrospora]
MSVVSLLNVNILDNPAPFSKPFKFEITFECLEPLTKDLEWKLIYVGSATSSEHDQELDSLLVGPIPVGVNKFEFTADPPNLARIPSSEILGVTVILLTAAYDGREFIRVGYYVSNEYDTEELNNEPPKSVQVERIVKNVLAEKPRVTRFAIKWDSEESAPVEFPPDLIQPEADLLPADGDTYGADEEEEEEEEEEAEPAPRDPDAMEEDTEMGGVPAAPGKDEEESAGEGSEDIESSTDEEEEEEEGEGMEEDEDMSMDHKPEDAALGPAPGGVGQPPAQQPIAQN